VDLQRWVDCLQNNNTFMAPHCATFYNCGLTSFDFPRGRIKHLSVVDKAVVTDLSSVSSGSGGSGSGGSSSSSGIAVGTVVATVADSQPILAAAKTLVSLYAVTVDQNFVIAATLGGQNCNLYNSVSPQYVRATVTYTDLAGATQSVQMGQVCRLSDCTVSSSLTIAAKGGTAIYYSLTPFNTPQTDGGVNASFVVTAAAASATVSAAGNTSLVINTTAASSNSATANGDWCNEIEYAQVEPCLIRNYLKASHHCGHCMPISDFFAIPSCFCGNKTVAAIPTDEGVDPALAPLPLGYHYPQESTDSPYGRALAGIWAIENGRIYVGPWIQSTEMIVVKWEGIKRDWVDADLVDDDPGLFRAVEMWLRWEHARDWDSDLNKAQAYEIEYRKALAELIYDCEEENRVRACEPGHARGIAPADVERFTTDDPEPPDPPNPPSPQYKNTVAGIYTATCESLWDGVSPHPAAFTVTKIVPVDSTPGTSIAEANQIAQDTAQALAEAALAGNCTFYNAAKSITVSCPAPNQGVSATGNVSASDTDCTSTISQAKANECATKKAKEIAEDILSPTCPKFSSVEVEFRAITGYNCDRGNGFICNISLVVISPAGYSTSSNSQIEADTEARNAAQAWAAHMLYECCVYLVENPTAVCTVLGKEWRFWTDSCVSIDRLDGPCGGIDIVPL